MAADDNIERAGSPSVDAVGSGQYPVRRDQRTAAEVGVPARGVLLNFCGCDHWNDKPFASEFDMAWLEAILEEKYGKNQKTEHQ